MIGCCVSKDERRQTLILFDCLKSMLSMNSSMLGYLNDPKHSRYYQYWKEFPTFAYSSWNCKEADIDPDECIVDPYYDFHDDKQTLNKSKIDVPSILSSILSPLYKTNDVASESRKEKIQRYKRYKEQSRAKNLLGMVLQEILRTESSYLSDLGAVKERFFDILFEKDMNGPWKKYSLAKIERRGLKKFTNAFYNIYSIHQAFWIDNPLMCHEIVINNLTEKNNVSMNTKSLSIWNKILLIIGIRKRSIRAAPKNIEKQSLEIIESSNSNISNTIDSSFHYQCNTENNVSLAIDQFIDKFKQLLQNFYFYGDYCAFYSMFVNVHRQYCSGSDMTVIDSSRKITLLDYLIRPVQRLCQYSLLLQQLKRYIICINDKEQKKQLDNLVQSLEVCISNIEQMKFNQERIEKTMMLEMRLKKSLIRNECIMKLSSTVMFKKANRKLTNTQLPLFMAILFEKNVMIVRSKESGSDESGDSNMNSSSLEPVKTFRLNSYKLSIGNTSESGYLIIFTKIGKEKQYLIEFLLPSEHLRWCKALNIDLIPFTKQPGIKHSQL